MVLETLLCILLHLAVIVSPGEYYQCEIDTFEQQNQAEIDAIHNDPPLENYVITTYSSQVEFIGIIDEDCIVN